MIRGIFGGLVFSFLLFPLYDTRTTTSFVDTIANRIRG